MQIKIGVISPTMIRCSGTSRIRAKGSNLGVNFEGRALTIMVPLKWIRWFLRRVPIQLVQTKNEKTTKESYSYVR